MTVEFRFAVRWTDAIATLEGRLQFGIGLLTVLAGLGSLFTRH